MDDIRRWAKGKNFDFRYDLESVAINAALWGGLCDSWIPRGLIEVKLVPALNPRQYLSFGCKTYQGFFDQLYNDALLVRVNGLFYYPAEARVVSSDIARSILIEKIENDGCVVSKAGAGSKGFGVSKLCSLADMEPILLSAEDCLFQELFDQHVSLSNVNRSSINSVRVVTFQSVSGVRVISGMVRFGRFGKFVDNRYSGGVGVAIESWSEGRLKPFGVDREFRAHFEHPDSGVRFDSIRVPGCPDIIDRAKTLHDQFPWGRLIAWDFCVDPDGASRLLEINSQQPGVWHHQGLSGPVFEEVYDEIRGACGGW